MTQAPPAQPQWSDDGQHWWDGTVWIPREAAPVRQAELAREAEARQREAEARQREEQAAYAERYAQWQAQQATTDPFAPGQPSAPVPWPPVGSSPPPPESPGKTLAMWSLIAGLIGFSLGAIALGHVSRSQSRKAGLRPFGMARWGLILGYLGGAMSVAALALIVWVVTGGLDERGPVGQSLRVAAETQDLYHDHYRTYTAALPPTGFRPADGVRVDVLRADATSYCMRGTGYGTTLYTSSAKEGVTRTPCL